MSSWSCAPTNYRTLPSPRKDTRDPLALPTHPSSQPPAATNLLPVSVDLAAPDTSCKWIPTTGHLSRPLLSLGVAISRFIHVVSVVPRYCLRPWLGHVSTCTSTTFWVSFRSWMAAWTHDVIFIHLVFLCRWWYTHVAIKPIHLYTKAWGEKQGPCPLPPLPPAPPPPPPLGLQLQPYLQFPWVGRHLWTR